MIHKSSNNRASYSYVKDTRHDDYKYVGFNYEGKQIKKSISSFLLKAPGVEEIIEQFEKMVFYLTEKSKYLVHWKNFAMDPRHTKFR